MYKGETLQGLAIGVGRVGKKPLRQRGRLSEGKSGEKAYSGPPPSSKVGGNERSPNNQVEKRRPGIPDLQVRHEPIFYA